MRKATFICGCWSGPDLVEREKFINYIRTKAIFCFNIISAIEEAEIAEHDPEFLAHPQTPIIFYDAGDGFGEKKYGVSGALTN